MRGNFIFLLCILFFSCKDFNKKGLSMECYHMNEDLCYIVPLTERDVISRGKKNVFSITENDYKNILSYIKTDKCIQEFEIEYLNLDFLDVLTDLNDVSVIEENSTETADMKKSTIKHMDDGYLDIRYVIFLRKSKSISKIAVGEKNGIVKFNDKYYEVGLEEFFKLKKFIKNYTDTAI